MMPANTLKHVETLVRLGIVPTQDLQFLGRALQHVEADTLLPINERKAFYKFIEKMMDVVFSDPTIFRLVRQKVSMNKYEEHEPVSESQLDLKRTPEGMLSTLSTNVKSKAKAGGKVSPAEKRLASRAKAELRRRRDNVFHKMKYRAKKKGTMKESYESAFLQIMQEYGITNIAELSNEHVKEFFNKVDTLYNSGE